MKLIEDAEIAEYFQERVSAVTSRHAPSRIARWRYRLKRCWEWPLRWADRWFVALAVWVLTVHAALWFAKAFWAAPR